MKIEANKVASFDYKLTNNAGEVLDSSEGGEPLAYLHGADNIIPGLEKELTGLSVGDSRTVTVPPEQGYGMHSEELIQAVPRSMFEGVDQIEVGMTFQAETDAGPQVVVVAAVDDENVTIDGNHPLAGETLHFDVTITEVRDATGEELEHGHVHAGGHCH